MKQLTILSGRCLVVELPSWETIEKELSIHGHDEGLTESEFKEYVYSKCPPGNWRIIGVLSEVTEDGLDGLIKPVKVFDYDAHYWNYKDKEYQPIRVDESLESAILAEGHLLESPPDPKCGCSGPAEEGVCDACDEWNETQSRVLCRERCLLLGREI